MTVHLSLTLTNMDYSHLVPIKPLLQIPMGSNLSR
jgi:hypothetical protein